MNVQKKNRICQITGKRLPSKNALKKKVVKLHAQLREMQKQWLQHSDDLKPLEITILTEENRNELE